MVPRSGICRGVRRASIASGVSAIRVGFDRPASGFVRFCVAGALAATVFFLAGATAYETRAAALAHEACPEGTNIIMGTEDNDQLTGTNQSDCLLGLGGDWGIGLL